MPSLSPHHSHGGLVIIPELPDECEAQLESGSHTSLCPSSTSLFPATNDETCPKSTHSSQERQQRPFKERVRLLSLYGTASDNYLIGIHSQPLHFHSLLFVCVLQTAPLPWHLSAFFICCFIMWLLPTL